MKRKYIERMVVKIVEENCSTVASAKDTLRDLKMTKDDIECVCIDLKYLFGLDIHLHNKPISENTTVKKIIDMVWDNVNKEEDK